MMRDMLGLLLLTFVPTLLYGYKIDCDEGWSHFSESPSCYLTVYKQTSTFNDAKAVCENYDAHLVIIDTIPEKDHVTSMMGQVARGYAWVGLELAADGSGWQWLDNSTVDTNVIKWANETSEGCGSLAHWGALSGKNCEDTLPYICERSLGAPKRCGEGWERYGQSCYKRYHHTQRPWDEARHACLEDNADLIVVNNHLENLWLYDFANRDQVDIWLGLRENKSENKYVWVNGVANEGSDVVADKWEDNEPKARDGNGAGIMASSSHDSWSTRNFDESLSFVCEKPVGDFCLFDMIEHNNFCYDFSIDPNVENMAWSVAKDGCEKSGLQMITVANHALDNWITKYLYDTGIFSVPSSQVNGMWLGYRETGKTTNKFTSDPGDKPLEGDDIYDARKADIQYSEELDCLFTIACPGNDTDDCIVAADEYHRWDSDQCDLPGFRHIQGCRLPKGQPIDVSNLMHPKMYCPEGWGDPFADACYLTITTEMSWGEARSFCKENNSIADLVTIFSPYENNYIKRMASDLGTSLWIGLSDQEAEGSFLWVDETPLGPWNSWGADEPNGGRTENCVEINESRGWNDKVCSYKYPFVCKMKASVDPSGDPILPDTSTMPPTNNCGYNSDKWVENPETGMCYSLVNDHLYTWEDAREHCRYLGGYREQGDLASINSAEEQQFFATWFTIIEHFSSTWMGLSDLNQESSFEWSDGSPFAYINWADTEPNGGNGENCGEFLVDDWTRGHWNDFICSEPLSFVCEKKGANYVEPPKPPKPEPSCPQNWQKIGDRCLYFSGHYGRTAANWTEANAICKGFSQVSSLVSMRSQADTDAYYQFVVSNTFIGGTDAAEEGTWIWTDGEPFTYEYWNYNEPNGNESENCIEMNYELQWNDIDCGANYNLDFICSSPIVLCPESWYYYDGQCWYFSEKNEAVPWQAAQDICRQGSSSANLLSIHNNEDNAFAAELVKDGNDGWLGLQIQGDNDYHWVDGSSFDFNAWKDGEPNNLESETCASISHDEGTWSSTNCDESLGFTCRFKSSHYVSCPSGWEKWNGNCYLLQPEVTAMVFDAAEDGCLSRGGHLATVSSLAELDFIQSYIASYHLCGNEWWTTDTQAQKCYYTSQDKLSWYDASASCFESDSTLVVIDSSQTNDKFVSFIQRGSSFWAGATDLLEEGVWRWSNDNSTLDCENGGFCDWHEGEPNGNAAESCLQVWNDNYWDTGHWNDAPCNDTLTHYICQKPLATDTRKTVWIGLKDMDNTGTLSWTDDSMPVTFTKWAPNQPFHHAGDEFQCTVLTTDNQMALVSCSEEHVSICKRPVEITSIPPDSYGCAEGQYEYQGSCYMFVHQHRTFTSAQSACQDVGGNLVSINDGDEQARLVSLLAETFGSFFIGLKYIDNSGMFEWVSGDAVSYTDAWDHSQPDLNGDYEKCAMVSTEGSSGYWFIGQCAEPHSSICELPRQGFTNPPTTTTTVLPEAQCESFEWNKYNDHCYRYFDTPLSFGDAELFCQSKGGHLISIGSADEENNLYSVNSYGYEFMWIGLRQDEAGEGGYAWTDGSPLDFTNYKTDQPEDHGGSDNCLIIDWQSSYSNGWESHNCQSELGFVCEVLAGMEPPTTLSPPTIQPPLECGDEGWMKPSSDSEYCYKFVVAGATTDSWDAAEYQCLQEGAHLASIHSNAENNFVMVNLKRAGIDNAFLGLYVNNDEQFAWTDGTIADYFSWSKGEPNNYMGLESCGVISTGSGHWNDAYCSRPQNGYTCKRLAEGEWTSPKPTEMPLGHCATDFYEFKGYCYKLFGLSGDVSDFRNWTDAQDECRKLGHLADLASIHSAQEQAFLSTLLAKHDPGNDAVYEFWIGFHDFVHWDYGDMGTFVWSDQSRVDYVNWAAGEPNSNFEYEGICVEMWAHDDYDIGHWNDRPCENLFPYLCKTRASEENQEPPQAEKCTDQYSDFDLFKGQCYKWVEEPATWQEAENKCRQMDGSHLVSLLTQSEQAFAFSSSKFEKAWLGLSDQDGYTGFFKWSDGWPMQISNWGENPFSSTEKTCVALNSTDGKWYPSSCQDRYPFLCKHSDALPPTPSPNGECPMSKFIDLDASFENCYYFHYGGVTTSWHTAHTDCLSLGQGSDLVSIHSEEEMRKISGELAKHQAQAWIGLFTTSQANGQYFWTDKSAFDYNNWQDGEPNGPTYEFCIHALSDNGKWNDAECDPYYGDYGYVCKAPKIQVTTGPTPKPTGSTVSTASRETTTPSKTTSAGQTTSTTSFIVTPSENNGEEMGGQGLSGGVIAIIVIVCLLATAGGAVFLVLFFRKESQLRKILYYRRQQEMPETSTSGFDNVAYSSQDQGGDENRT